MDITNYNRTALLEACLFASPSYVTVAKLAEFMECSEEEVLASVETLSSRYERENSGLCLINKEGNLTITTKPMLGEAVAYFLQTRRFGVLSNAAYEVLAIAAYNQPVTKTYISQVRGIASSEVVESLVEKGLLRESGRIDLPGRPMGYVTTEKFLTVFNLDSLDSLPVPEEFDPGVERLFDPNEQPLSTPEEEAQTEESAE